MKNLIGLVFIFIILCLAIKVKAQGISDTPTGSFPYNLGGQTVMAYDNRYEGVKGTYTFSAEFMRGSVELKKGKFNNVLINYDAITDNLLAINDKLKDTVQMRKDLVTNFVMSNAEGETFAFSKQSVKGVPTFLLNIVRDTISMFCRVGKTVKKAEIGGAYNTSEKRYDEFVTVNTYYVVKEKDGLQEIQKNKKGILQAFPEFDEQLSAYLKKNKIDFNDYAQMKLLMLYVNTLKERSAN
jgi:hypothetical protein